MPSENKPIDAQEGRTEPRIVPAGSRFMSTSWTVVLQAVGSDIENAKPALASLCQTYWYPLYVYIRRRGWSVADSEDLTQSFFASLLDQNRLAQSDQSRGRFRTFLLAALDNFLKNQHRYARALKRGGGTKTMSIDFESAENRYRHEPAHELTPEKIFDRSWAIALLNQVLANLKQQYDDSGKSELFEALRGQLVGDNQQTNREIAERLRMKEGAIKVALFRMRERYGQQLRLQIARTIDQTDQVDEELQHLFDALAD